MNLTILISPEPGIRYRAHIHALQQLCSQITFIEIHGFPVLKSKISRQLSLLKKKGLRSYGGWRLKRHLAKATREEVTDGLNKHFADRPFASAALPKSASFPGFTPALASFIRKSNPDYVLQCGSWIIPADFISQVPTLLNLHPGILPGIRGLDPVFWALYMQREDWLGSTLHIIDSGIDTGEPLLRRRLERRPGESMVDLIARQIELEMDLLGLFSTHQPQGFRAFDEGGAAKSIYKSNWTAEEYRRLKAAQWWGSESNEYSTEITSPTLTAPGRPRLDSREPAVSEQ